MEVGDHAWAVAIAEVRREAQPKPSRPCLPALRTDRAQLSVRAVWRVGDAGCGILRCFAAAVRWEINGRVPARLSRWEPLVGRGFFHLVVPALVQAWRASARLSCRSKDALRETMYSCGMAWDFGATAARWPPPPRLCL